MKSMFFPLVILLGVAGACQPQGSNLSSKKKNSDSNQAESFLAKKVDSLKKESGTLRCSGMDAKSHFVRTEARFTQGKLTELNVSAFANKGDANQPVNDLTADLQKYQIFSNELSSKALDLDVDLDGKKMSIEVIAELNGKARKIYDLDIRLQDDGEGGKALNAFLTYRNTSMDLDLSEVLMGCSVQP
jgi:hypothetical protein